MAQLIPDTLDFSAYERGTECRVKVRPASSFGDDLLAEFAPASRLHTAEMMSTKLRGLVDFRAGEVTVWAGYNGHRKSMIVGQVALDMAEQRHRTLIASMEMSPARTLARMARQAFATHKPADDQLQRFSEWTDGRVWIFDHIGRVIPDTMLAVCNYFATELQGKQVFIDSFMMACASEESLDEQKQFATDLVRVAQETGLHIHCVAHCRKPTDDLRPPTKYDIKGSGSISDVAHNVITVWANRAKKAALELDATDSRAAAEPDQFLSVEKQRNGEFEGRVKLWFDDASFRFTDSRLHPVAPYSLKD